jgi:hypothetical protein
VMGPRVVPERPVPAFAQMVHFARTWTHALTRPHESQAAEAGEGAQS